MSSKSHKKSASGVKNMATETWEKLEQVFESRVARVLNAMQIPTHEDVQQLAHRVEALTHAVEKLSGEPLAATPRKPAATKRSKSSKRSAAKKRAPRAAAKKRPRPAEPRKRSSKKNTA